MRRLIGLVMIAPLFASSIAEACSPANEKNPVAVQAVLAGERTTANAAWWGFDDLSDD